MIFRIERAREEHGNAILRLAYKDPILNALLLYDWIVLRRRQPNACDFYVAIDELSGSVVATCVVFHDRGFDSILFCGDPKANKTLIESIKPERAVLPRVLPEEEELILEALKGQSISVYDVLIMACRPESFRPIITHRVVKLGPEHAELYSRFCREERRARISLDEARKRLSEEDKPVFAVIIDGRIVSTALIYASLPEVSLVGGVYTVPEFRGRGLATSVTSRATEEALSYSKVASLIVRADNEPAIKIYRRIGYEVYRRSKWFNVNVSIVP